jgi:hypothetical protein
LTPQIGIPILEGMKTKDVIEFFGGTQLSAAEALGLAQSSIATWGVYPPKLRQLQIQAITKGKLKAERWCLDPKAKAAGGSTGRGERDKATS